MRRLRTVTVASLAVLTLSMSACTTTEPRDREDIVIGVDLELSGSSAEIGTTYLRALELKVDQINLTGVLGGRRLRLLVTDNRSDRSLAVTNVASLASNDGVTAMITGACGECMLVSASTVNTRRMPTITLAPAQGVAFPVAERRYIFKVAPNPQDSAATLAVELRRAGVDAVGVLSTQDEYGRDGLFALGRELEKAGIDRIAEGEFRPTDTELDQVVSEVINKNPDALVFYTYPSQARTAAVAARSMGFTGQFYFDTGAAGDLFFVGPAVAATENAILISSQTMSIDDVIANTPAKAARKQWFRDYMSRYGGYHGYASYAADAMQMLVNAVETVGGTSRERIREVLETTRMDGLSGPIRITPDNHSGLIPQALTVLVGRGGRWRLAG